MKVLPGGLGNMASPRIEIVSLHFSSFGARSPLRIFLLLVMKCKRFKLQRSLPTYHAVDRGSAARLAGLSVAARSGHFYLF